MNTVASSCPRSTTTWRLGKGDHFCCFRCVGTSSTESTTSFSAGSYNSATRRISPDLALDVLFQRLLGPQGFQICLGSRAAHHHGIHGCCIFTLLVPADMGKHQGQTKRQVTAAGISYLHHRLSALAHTCTVNQRSL